MDEALCPSCQEIVDVLNDDGTDGFCNDCDRCRACCEAAPGEACDYWVLIEPQPMFI